MRIKLKVLLVFDTEQGARPLIDELTSHGYRPNHTVSTDFTQIESGLATGSWDIVLIDSGSRGYDRQRILRRIRDVNTEIPVLVVLGDPSPDGENLALQAGADDVIRRDGLEHLVRVMGEVLHDKEIRRLRQQVEQSLWESEKRYRELVMNMGEGLVLLDADGRFSFANPMAEKFFGMTSLDLLGQSIRDFLDDEQQLALEGELESLDQGRQTALTLTLSQAETGDLVLRVTFNPRYDSNGEFLGMIGSMMNITEQVSLERQIRHMQTMEAIGALAGGIAHDFNNILFSILGNVDLALSEIDPDHKVHRRLENIVTAGNRAKSLIKQILAFARKTEHKRLNIEVYPIVREVQKLLRATIPANIEINYKCLDREATVIADPTELHQVVMNLCTNACHAMMRTGGELEIVQSSVDAREAASLYREDFPDGQDLVKLEIRDTGTGIPEEILSKIFEPFFTTKAPSEGTGLGLVVAQGIVKSMSGLITVDSTVGEGTCFSILLPRTEAQVDDFEAFINELPHGTERILIVDDEEALTRMLSEMLTSLGYRVTTFNSSQQALAAFTENPESFDLVVTDQAMPKMTGGELAQNILRIRPGLPIILCTGFSQTLTPELARKTGINEYLLKPVTMEDLSNSVRSVLDGMTQAAQAAEG